MISKDYIVLNVPYPVKFLGLTLLRKRKIGFLFTNLSLHLFRENNGLKNSDDYNNWLEKNNESRLISEVLYAAAQAYCSETIGLINQNFTKSLLSVGIDNLSDHDKEILIDKWQKSQTYGAKYEVKKKNQPKRPTTPMSTPSV